ncbi:MAG: sulfatase, partial [Candidatus Eiseniibacteriota bacterium]
MTRPAPEPNPLLDTLRAGALAWTAFAVGECWFFSILPRLLRPDYALSPVHGGFSALTFAFYPVLGATLSAAVAVAARAARWRVAADPSAVAVLCLVLALDANLVHLLFQGVDSPFSFRQSRVHLALPLAASLVLAFAAVRRGKLAFLANPWTVSLLLVGLPWMTVGQLAQARPWAKGLAAAAWPVAVVLGSWLAARLAGRARRPRHGLAWLGGFAVVTLALSATGEQTVRETGEPPAPRAGAPKPPNVVLITMDTVRADHLSLYGYERDTTPELRALAAEATLYARAVASGDMTLTTHGSLFTGLYGRQHGAHRSESIPTGRPLATKFVTAAEILTEAGYWTGAVVANTAYLSNAFGFDQGFQYYDVRTPVLLLGKSPPWSPRRWLHALCAKFAPLPSVERKYRDARDINAAVLPLLDRFAERGAPFFLFVNYMDAHLPLIPPEPFDTLWPGKDETFTTDRYYEILRSVIRGDGALPDAVRDHLVSQYDGAIAYVDSEIGALIRELGRRGLWDDTLFIVTSDHGEAFGENSLLNHGVSVYQDQVAVPLLVRYPGAPGGLRVEELASSVDVLPTILDVTGISLPRAVPGRTLREIAGAGDRLVAAESFPFLFDVNPAFRRIERAVFAGPHKLITSTTGKRELYDLSRDASETEDLYQPGDSLTADLEARLGERGSLARLAPEGSRRGAPVHARRHRRAPRTQARERQLPDHPRQPQESLGRRRR